MKKCAYYFLAVLGNKTFKIFWILSLALLAIQVQAQQIKSTDPYQYPEFNTVAGEDLELKGTDLIPPGSTFQTIPQNVKVFFDDGAGWKQGSIVIPGKGWGVANLTVKTPVLQARVPGIKVKLVVKGVESNVYTIPVFVINTSGPPKIIAIKPEGTGIGSNDYWFLVEVFTNGSARGLLYFNNQRVQNYITQVQTPDVIMNRFSVPQEVRNTPGSYPIQFKGGNNGDTNIVYWTLAAPTTITKLTPSYLTKAQTTAGAPPVTVNAIFSGSAPKTIHYRIDKTGGWYLVQQPITFGNQTTFSLPLGNFQPKSQVEIKMVNVAGEAIKALNVLPSAQDKLESTMLMGINRAPVSPKALETPKSSVRIKPLPPK